MWTHVCLVPQGGSLVNMILAAGGTQGCCPSLRGRADQERIGGEGRTTQVEGRAQAEAWQSRHIQNWREVLGTG